MKSIPKAKEESAGGMGQRSNDTYAAMMDAQIKLRKEECV